MALQQAAASRAAEAKQAVEQIIMDVRTKLRIPPEGIVPATLLATDPRWATAHAENQLGRHFDSEQVLRRTNDEDLRFAEEQLASVQRTFANEPGRVKELLAQRQHEDERRDRELQKAAAAHVEDSADDEAVAALLRD